MNCKRCGIPLSEEARIKRKDRKEPSDKCIDCNARPMKQITKKGDWCYPYPGELDEHLRPIDEQGNLYKPGVRTCGYSDCTRAAHVISYGLGVKV